MCIKLRWSFSLCTYTIYRNCQDKKSDPIAPLPYSVYVGVSQKYFPFFHIGVLHG